MKIGDSYSGVDDLDDFVEGHSCSLRRESYIIDLVTLVIPDADVPWEKLPDELDRHWVLFERFRDLGPSRTVQQIATESSYSSANVYKISKNNKWVERVAQYDDYIRRIELEEHYRARRELAKRHMTKAREMLEALMAPVEALQARLDKDPIGTLAELEDMPIQKLIAQVQASARVLQPIMNAERLAQGLPTEIREDHQEHVHSIDLSSADRIGDILRSLEETNLLSHFLGEGTAGEVVDAEVVEMDPHNAPPEADGFSARSAS